MSKTLNIFAIGNVLDPHVRIDGECLIDNKHCGECGGQRTASALVRLSGIITPMRGAEFVGTRTAASGGAEEACAPLALALVRV